MPTKREYSAVSDEKPIASSPPEKSPRKKKTDWTPDEEAKFLAIIDEIVKTHLWSMAKEDPDLAARKGGAVRSHWDALFKKLKKS
ncbi:uncharacterized protein I303_104608 [Kwoniella dejecticola CBS 10117]|uniref:Myb-like domain-containing protein n=1 Tax=Kwoniella dejecticola CBS 10117 TaxID=1296121 RepID=A0A1A6A4X3_9TREE|nr:uncharacterized protein I303_04414 [Kwoniella dejecticola CBS 10117]OBR85083.1 hypothetical protein I303_04414 [Kwoniella dejecticola CBS 10117]